MKYFVLIFAALTLAAKTKPAPKPRVIVPENFSRPLDSTVGLNRWWQQFEDKYLETLIERAHANNRDLALSQSRLLEARSTTQSTRAGLFPSASTSLGFTNSQRSNNSPAIPRFDTPPGATGSGADLIPRRYSLFDTAFDVSYEFDFYGANRKSYAATKSDQQAQQEDLNDTRISLTAELARDYFDLREAQARLDLARRNLANYEQSLELIRLRRRAGLSNELDEIRLQAQIASALASLPNLEGRIEQSIAAIGLITGDSSEKLNGELGNLVPLPSVPKQIPGGLPAELLQRRPDVRKAYAQLDAAASRRQSAQTDWFPKLKLTTSTGGQSGDFTNLLSTGSIISTFAPKLSWGAFNFKQTRANIAQKQAREDQQLATLEKAILTAFKDVETALSNYYREQDRLTHLQAATAAQLQLAQVNRMRHDAGLDTLIPVLEAERSEINALDAELQSQANIRRNLVTLFKALGGGW